MLLDEFVESKAKIVENSDEEETENNDIKDAKDMNAFISHWNKEFERLNPNPEDNSDFDSDNDINPLDTLTPAGKYMSSRQL